jgi:pyridoxamine 5'-phosphate oxidase
MYDLKKGNDCQVGRIGSGIYQECNLRAKEGFPAPVLQWPLIFATNLAFPFANQDLNSMSIDQMRENYSLAGLSRQEVDEDPLVQFAHWFEQANQPDLPDWVEINAMTLATSSPGGHVSSRIVLLKGIDQGKLSFFTNYESTKGQQIGANPMVSLCIHWPHLQRQVRVEGTVTKSERAQSEDYFHARPRGSQLGAHVSQQSAVVANRQALDDRMSDLESQYADQRVPCPSNWGGYEVRPDIIEFWQGRSSRLHDRLRYRRDADGWVIERLSP